MRALRKIIFLSLCVGCGRPHKEDQGSSQPPAAQVHEEQTPVNATAENNAVGELRGYEQIDRLLRERIMGGSPDYSSANYLGDGNVLGGGLSDLLGVMVGTGVDAGFRNGTPNPVNTVLYDTIFASLSADLASVCDIPDRNHPAWKKLSPTMQNALSPMCAWPLMTAQSDMAMDSFWTAVMAFDAPEIERNAWKTFFREQLAKENSHETIVSMLNVMLQNPHFLLKK